MSWVLGPTKIQKKKEKKNIKADIGQAKTCIGDQASEGEADGEEGEWASAGVPRFPRIISREGPLILLIVGKVKAEIQAGIGIDNLLLKGKPPRNPLIRRLGPQSSNNFVPLSHQSYLLMKIPTQPATLLSQAFH